MEPDFFPEESPPCTCDRCKELCRRPCWPTPTEVEHLLAAGYGQHLMLAWWEGSQAQGGYTMVVCPALQGYSGFYAPDPEDWPQAHCIMQTPEGLCHLHEARLKPLEGRLASACSPYPGARVRRALAALWATPEGKRVVDYWRQHFAR